MDNVLTIAPSTSPANLDVTNDQLELIKRSVAKGATNDELKLFLYDCKRRGVHPLDKLIHFTVHSDKSGKRSYTPIVGIDFMRMKAAETGEHVGTSLPIFEGQPGKTGFGCTVTVKRLIKGHVAEFSAQVFWDEFFPGEQKGFMWKKMPRVMLSKVAESHALRKGFPAELSGLYTNEEMDQAGQSSSSIDLGQAMMQDFPIGQELHGFFKQIVPSSGSTPPQAIIEVDGLNHHLTLFDASRFAHMVDSHVIFQVGKQGRLRVVTDMRVQEEPRNSPSVKTQATQEDTPPQQQPMPDDIPHYRMTVESVVKKTGKNGEFAILTLGDEGGSTLAGVYLFKPPHACGVEDYMDLEAQEVFVVIEEEPSKDGKKVFKRATDLIPCDQYEASQSDDYAGETPPVEAYEGEA